MPFKLRHLKPSLLLASLCGLLLLALFDFWPTGYSWNDQQRIAQLLLLICAGALLLLPYTQHASLPNRAGWLVFGVLSFGLVSSLLSAFPSWALKEWGRYAGMLLLVIMLAHSARTSKIFRSLLYFLCTAASLNAFLFVILYIMAIVSGIKMFNADLLFSGFSNPRFLNQFQMLFMPVLAWGSLHHLQATHRYSKPLAIIFLVTLITHWCIALSLGSRGLWLGLAAAHFALLLFFPRYWRLLAVQILAALLGFTLYQLLFFIIPEWLGQEAWLRSSMRFGLSKREVIWSMAWKMFADNPWLGVGPMHFAAKVNSVAAHPHQVILQWLAEWGLFATLCACTLAIWGMLHGIRFLRNSPHAQPVDAALWLSIGGALAVAQVDGVFVMPYTEIWLAILIGLALARWQHQQPVAVSHSSIRSAERLQNYSYRTLAIAVLLILGNVLVNEVPTLPEDSQYHMETQHTGFTPRFWLQGWIPMEKAP